jgi:hypothetical protein
MRRTLTWVPMELDMRRLMGGMPYLLSLLLLVALSGHAAAQSAEAPTFMVGDEWKWSSGPVQTVVKVDGDVTVIKGTRGCATCLVHFNKSFVMMNVAQADGSPTDTSVGFVPVGSEWKLLDFPLQVGKKWNVGAKGFFENRVRHYDIVISVQDYEDVTTKGARSRHSRSRATGPSGPSAVAGAASPGARPTGTRLMSNGLSKARRQIPVRRAGSWCPTRSSKGTPHPAVTLALRAAGV